MGFFKKSNTTDDIKKAVGKVRERYQCCSDDFDTAHELCREFEDRYFAALKKSSINMLHLLYQEYLTADAIYKAAQEKELKKKSDETRLKAVKERDVAGNIYAEFDNRIKKYVPSGYVENDNELNRLYGAFKKVYNSVWIEAEPILRKKYKAGFQNPVHEISSDLYEFVPRPGEKIPHSLFLYKTAIRRNEKEQAIENRKNQILKKAAFLLHKIVSTVSEAREDEFYFSSDEQFRLETIEETVNGIIYDFRLISFHGKANPHR